MKIEHYNGIAPQNLRLHIYPPEMKKLIYYWRLMGGNTIFARGNAYDWLMWSCKDGSILLGIEEEYYIKEYQAGK